eukprot:scaffold14080_cov101-Isochrysis_galbana.AAC.2
MLQSTSAETRTTLIMLLCQPQVACSHANVAAPAPAAFSLSRLLRIALVPARRQLRAARMAPFAFLCESVKIAACPCASTSALRFLIRRCARAGACVWPARPTGLLVDGLVASRL